MQSESPRDKLPKCNWLEKKSRCWLSTGGSGLFEPLVLCCECRPLRRQYPFKLARQMARVGGRGDPGQEDANLPELFACVLKSLCCPKWPCLNSDLPIARTFANVASQSSSTCGAPSGTSSSPSSKPCKKPFPPRSMWPSSSSLITSGRNRRPTSAAPSSSLRWDRPLVSLLSAPLCSQCIPLFPTLSTLWWPRCQGQRVADSLAILALPVTFLVWIRGSRNDPKCKHHYTILFTVDGNVHGVSISDSNIPIVSKLFKNVSVDLVILLENYSYKTKLKD